MPDISFYAGATKVSHLSGSGLGFFGGSFGQSVELNKFQDTTYITNGAGTIEGAAVNNLKYSTDTLSFAPSIVPATGLKYIPNEKATVNVRFTNASVVKTQNVKLRIFDRSDSNNPASGVTTRTFELIHPQSSYSIEGSGDSKWWGSSTHDGTDAQGTFTGSPNRDARLPVGANTVGGSGIVMPLAQSPGASGLWAGNGSGGLRQDTQHDWYVGISASPDSIGSKTQYGLYGSLASL